jgi:Heavy metal binding domain
MRGPVPICENSLAKKVRIPLKQAIVRTLFFLLAAVAAAQDSVYVCPMDPDVRSSQPGLCPRCGMKLVAGLPEPVEYHMDMAIAPRLIGAGEKVKLSFTVRDPWKARPVTRFQAIHERLFHLFVVSQNLEFFAHGHPAMHPDGAFSHEIAFPTPGMYRLLADFYPDGATPQLIAKTLIVPGAAPPAASLGRDYSPKDANNLRVELATEPAQPMAGINTLLSFRLAPADGLEPYLGAWGHMLAASDDLIDLIHTHPFRANGPLVQFNVEFPRARTYRVWVQFQRKGVVNTARFDLPVTRLQ